MAIEWGPYTNHMRVGIDVWTDNYDTYTPSINVYVAVYVQCSPSWNFADNQHVALRGSVSADWAFYNNLQGGQTRHMGTATIGGQGQSYGGGPTYTLDATLSGNYLGANSHHVRYYTLPARPKRPPSAAGAPFYTNIRATAVDSVGWALPSDVGGGTLDHNWLQVGRTNFGNLIYDNITRTTGGRSLSGLAPGTTYYARAAWHTEAGWGPFGPVSSFTTASYTAGTPTVSNIGPDGVTVAWTAPNDTKAPTGYQLQISSTSNFSSGVSTMSGGWATSRQVANLTPGTKYWARVRADSGSGWGAWSASTPLETLSGAKIGIDGVWKDAIAYGGVNGQWRQLKVYKGINGAWSL